MSSIPSRNRHTPKKRGLADLVTALIPDFPFDYGAFLKAVEDGNKASLFSLPEAEKSKRVLVVGAGAAGAVAAYELLRMGLKPVLVEASDRYGGRMHAHHLGEGAQEVIAELGCMRFPASGRAAKHYFTKLGMWENGEDFPNPGSEAAGSTVVDYQGRQVYYEAGSDDYPIPSEYVQLEEEMFGEDGFLNRKPTNLYEMWDCMTGEIDPVKQETIKQIWNDLLTKEKWDDISFYEALTRISGWGPDKINLFGQIGFGTGGWNTDYPNCILEVMRVLYTSLDVDHRLMRDGTSTLPRMLIMSTPEQLGDYSDPATADKSVQDTSREILRQYFGDSDDLTNKEVRHVSRNLITGKLDALVHDTRPGAAVDNARMAFDAVIYTPHVRILDKFRHYGTPSEYRQSTVLLSQQLWEAIEYTHYMQSSKIFMATNNPFWKERLPPGGENDPLGRYPMSVTLSDRLTRGTYLVNYENNQNTSGAKGCGIFLSYTWNDDSLKFLGDRNMPAALLTHANMCRTVLQDIYRNINPNLNLADRLADGGDVEAEINWENDPLYLGAFKMNLPGQYEYQRRLFSQFMAGVNDDGVLQPGYDGPAGFVLAGDDISWVAGWVEGAITSAVNAVNKIAVLFGGGDWPDGKQFEGPITQWKELKPIELPSPKVDARKQPHPSTRPEPSEAL
ncbi:flavin monoamine oxidase family protein [Dyella sp.]|uniref:flavin monoamine oxidase family protein n=1 Tax=Dyella sp. TaxID=1869338 RepID=UPI002B4724D5|nr:FAD-dependent oxidoreductase [Dyella sp.]HKT30356.1 FAD-dependent oxidoreductase [Dyella sp.]